MTPARTPDELARLARGMTGTFVTIHGLMLDDTGLALCNWIKENEGG